MRRVTVIAPGPSLTLAECMSAARAGMTVAVNSAIFMAPFATALYAPEKTWWRLHGDFLDWFPGMVWTDERAGTNSGTKAIKCAIDVLAPDQILLVGFDCGWEPGHRRHVHGDHPERLADGTKGCGNPMTADPWIADHARLADNAPVPIINCSSRTALTCYPRSTISKVLHGNRG